MEAPFSRATIVNHGSLLLTEEILSNRSGATEHMTTSYGLRGGHFYGTLLTLGKYDPQGS